MRYGFIPKGLKVQNLRFNVLVEKQFNMFHIQGKLRIIKALYIFKSIDTIKL